MTLSSKDWLSRRPVIAGLGAVVGSVAVGIGLDLMQPRHRRATGPDAYLINNLSDPPSGAIVGRAILAQARNGEAAVAASRAFAKSRLPRETLPQAVATDVAQNFLTEADGWVLPVTVSVLCVLAAGAM